MDPWSAVNLAARWVRSEASNARGRTSRRDPPVPIELHQTCLDRSQRPLGSTTANSSPVGAMEWGWPSASASRPSRSVRCVGSTVESVEMDAHDSPDTPDTPRGSILGNRVVRTEDPGLLTGSRRYVADLRTRSAPPRRVRTIRHRSRHDQVDRRRRGRDRCPAWSPSGRRPNSTWRRTTDSPRSMTTSSDPRSPPTRSDSSARPYAVVFAETLREGVDAAQTVWADIDPLPAVTDAEAALADDAPVLFAAHGSNLAVGEAPTPHSTSTRSPTSSSAAATSISGSRSRRWSRTASRPRRPTTGGSRSGRRTSSRTTSTPASPPPRASPPERLHLITPQVGGGFGGKAGMQHEYTVVVLAADRLGRAGELGPDPQRGHDGERPQPRPGPVRRGRVPPRRHVHRSARAPRRRRRRLSRHRRSAAGRHPPDVARHVRLPGDRLRRRGRGDQHTARRARTAAPADPRPRRCSNGSSTRPPTNSASTRSSSACGTCSPTTSSPSPRSPATCTTAGDTALPLRTAAEAIGYDDLRREQAERRRARRHGPARHRRGVVRGDHGRRWCIRVRASSRSTTTARPPCTAARCRTARAIRRPTPCSSAIRPASRSTASPSSTATPISCPRAAAPAVHDRCSSVVRP